MTPGPIALVGSGEYLPQMADVERALLAGRPARYVQLATAAVPDGPDVVAKWHALGRAQAERLGVEPVIVAVNDRSDADDPDLAALISKEEPGLVYLSGGHPTFLADVLRDTLVWAAVTEAWQAGAALAGCSAGAMVMTSWVPSIRHPRKGATPGLAILPHLRVIPHFDAFAARLPDLVTRFMVPPDQSTLIGIDEDTAIVGGPGQWQVHGRRSAWVIEHDGRTEYPSGSILTVPT
ncbi:MAG TPA: Type 1 glutamine amidotransferase-like domain-containing protein [Acidimicrobiales bacterium]|nr:Type 1 glutamine amidotransferase-like domain-containing protein [Acidimicrobiales bacterium]